MNATEARSIPLRRLGDHEDEVIRILGRRMEEEQDRAWEGLQEAQQRADGGWSRAELLEQELREHYNTLELLIENDKFKNAPVWLQRGLLELLSNMET